jgi:hypothetical protein
LIRNENILPTHILNLTESKEVENLFISTGAVNILETNTQGVITIFETMAHAINPFLRPARREIIFNSRKSIHCGR